MDEPHVSTDEALIGELESLLIALDMHPMFRIVTFRILRLNLRDMKADRLPPELRALKDRFAAMPDDDLLPVWFALHNPFRLEGRVLN